MSNASLFIRQDFVLKFIFYFRSLLLVFQSGTWNLTVFVTETSTSLSIWFKSSVCFSWHLCFCEALAKVSSSWASISFLSILDSEISCSMKSVFHMATCIFLSLSLSFQKVFCFCKPHMLLSLSILTGSSFSADEYLYGFFWGEGRMLKNLSVWRFNQLLMKNLIFIAS